MAKQVTTARKRAAKKAPAEKPGETAAAAVEDKAAPGTDAAAANPIPAASGGEAKPEGAAAPEGGTEPKASENENSSGAADPAGTAPAPAAGAEETREQAGAAPTDRKGAAEEGNEPGASARPPVAGPDGIAFVVKGPKGGFRRGGLAFGAEPRALTPADFGDSVEGARRLLAILEEPRLTCTVRLEDGREGPMLPELLEHLRASIEEAAAAA